MNFTPDEIDILKNEVAKRMSEKRFTHTLGVAKTACEIGKYFPFCSQSELEAAALLHDVAKEISSKELDNLMQSVKDTLTDDDFSVKEAYHSFLAPLIIKRDFSKFATDNILSSVTQHTLGEPEMSVFSLIIFVSDFIEPGRQYEGCIKTREYLNSLLSLENSQKNNLSHLASAAVMSIEYTEASLISRGAKVHPKTVLTKNYLLTLI